MNVVAIKELMWTYHPLPDTFKVVPFAEIKDANADVYVQANIKECKKEKKIGAYSVWVSKKPFLSKLANLKRREEVEFGFKGGVDSIYSNIPAHVYIINK